MYFFIPLPPGPSSYHSLFLCTKAEMADKIPIKNSMSKKKKNETQILCKCLDLDLLLSEAQSFSHV